MQSRLSIIAVFVLLIAPLALPAEAVTVLAGTTLAAWVVARRLVVPLGWGTFLLPLLVLIGIGLLGFSSYPFRDVLRDLWYVGKVPVYFLTGYFLAWTAGSPRKLMAAFVLAGVVAAMVHLSRFVANPWLLAEPIFVIREEAGKGSLLYVVGIATILSAIRGRVRLFGASRVPELAALVVLSAALLLSFSRTYVVCLAIMLLFSTGGLALLSRHSHWNAARIRFAISCVMLVLVGVAAYIVASRTDPGILFLEKMSRSLHELSIASYNNPVDMTMNWRGYEMHRLLETYRDGTTWQWMFGQGFGRLVDMSVHMYLGEDLLRYIPITHNGFGFLLLKTGIGGVLLYVWFLLRFFGEAIRAFDSSDVERWPSLPRASSWPRWRRRWPSAA